MRSKNAVLVFIILAICSLMFFACSSDDNETEDGFELTVVYLGTEYTVDVLALETTLFEEIQMVKLTDILNATGVETDWTKLYYDFEAKDGFNPRTQYTCDGTIPITGDAIDKGYVDPVSHRLNWDESLGYSGCASVKDLVKIFVNDDPEDGAIDGDTDGDEDSVADGDEDLEQEEPSEFKINVTYNGNDNEVDVFALDTEEIEGVTAVSLENIVIASGIVTTEQVEDGELGFMSFEFEASDGYNPGSKESCAPYNPLPGWQLAEGYVNLNEKRIYWKDGSGIGGCMGVKDIAKIMAEDKYVLTVTYDDTQARVVVEDMGTVEFDSSQVVSLDSLVTTSELVQSLDGMTYDFMATDGFMPSSKDNCKDYLPVDAATLQKGYLNPEDHQVYWDADLSMPGCASVKGLAVIQISAAE